MVSSKARINLRRSSELTQRDDQCVFQQSALFEIIQQHRHGMVQIGTQLLMCFKVLTVAVPPRSSDFDKRNTGFNQSTSNQTLMAELSRSVTRLHIGRFFRDIE